MHHDSENNEKINLSQYYTFINKSYKNKKLNNDKLRKKKISFKVIPNHV